MEEQPINYKDFLARLNLPDDKISDLLYDLYKYKLTDDEKEHTKRENENR